MKRNPQDRLVRDDVIEAVCEARQENVNLAGLIEIYQLISD